MGPVQWATTHSRADLVERLLAEMDVPPLPLVLGLKGSSRKPSWECPSLITRAALSGNEDIMRLLLAQARDLSNVDVTTVLKYCRKERIFRLLADECSRPLKALGNG